MSPRVDTPGLGVGLPVIAAIAQSVEIGTPENGGTEVRMRFALAGAAE
jgi:serine/threonine-protein kinase RsbW/stage II sporulation protein AB (anti-sigma F factor)